MAEGLRKAAQVPFPDFYTHTHTHSIPPIWQRPSARTPVSAREGGTEAKVWAPPTRRQYSPCGKTLRPRRGAGGRCSWPNLSPSRCRCGFQSNKVEA